MKKYELRKNIFALRKWPGMGRDALGIRPVGEFQLYMDDCARERRRLMEMAEYEQSVNTCDN